MAITGAQLVADALVTILQADPTDSVPAEDSAFVLRRLNRLLDSWANENLLVYALGQESFAMTPGQASYSTALLAAGRPMGIASMFIRLGTVDFQIGSITLEQYNAIGLKATQGVPSQCYYEPTFPAGTMYFYLVPNSNYTCFVNSYRPLVAGTVTETTSISLPPGYEKALVDNLAVDIAPGYSIQVDPALFKSAQDAKTVLKRKNSRTGVLQGFFDQAVDPSQTFVYKGF